MDKIKEALELAADATDAQVLKAIANLKKNQKPTADAEFEAAVNAKIAAGLSRDVAVDAVNNQRAYDAANNKK